MTLRFLDRAVEQRFRASYQSEDGSSGAQLSAASLDVSALGLYNKSFKHLSRR